MQKGYAKKQLKVYERKLQLIEKLLQATLDTERRKKLVEKGFYSSREGDSASSAIRISYWLGLKLQYQAKVDYYKEKLQ